MTPTSDFKKKRVAAYCRVSTDKKIQKTSIKLQTEAFKQTISAHPDWKLAKVYADEGLTGTTAKRRIQFQKMIEDAKNGKIDYILTKSISRFARNTMDTLKYTRELKEIGIGVYFEEQGIDTLSVTSEIFLTIHAAFAQEESHSISENMKRGVRNRFALGIPKWSKIYGYKKVNDNDWAIIEEEAENVKIMFDMYLKGSTLKEICNYLMEKKVAPPVGDDTWYPHSISTILQNEKYTGDVEMQKYYSADFLNHKKIKNNKGILPKTYIKNHHEAIIDHKTSQTVKAILLMKDSHRGCQQYPFYGFLKCPYCGENMIATTLKTKNFERAWTCGGKKNSGTLRKERTECKPVCVKEKYIISALLQTFQLEKIEYYDLIQNVEKITFVKNNWSILKVYWLDGRISKIKIDYKKYSEIPTANIKFFNDEIYFDDKLMGTNGHIKPAALSILNIMDYLQEIQIIDDENGFCPIVIKPTSMKGKKK